MMILIPGKLYKTSGHTSILPLAYKDIDGSTWLLDSANDMLVGRERVVMYIAEARYDNQACAVILVEDKFAMICDFGLKPLIS